MYTIPVLILLFISTFLLGQPEFRKTLQSPGVGHKGYPFTVCVQKLQLAKRLQECRIAGINRRANGPQVVGNNSGGPRVVNRYFARAARARNAERPKKAVALCHGPSAVPLLSQRWAD